MATESQVIQNICNLSSLVFVSSCLNYFIPSPFRSATWRPHWCFSQSRGENKKWSRAPASTGSCYKELWPQSLINSQVHCLLYFLRWPNGKSGLLCFLRSSAKALKTHLTVIVLLSFVSEDGANDIARIFDHHLTCIDVPFAEQAPAMDGRPKKATG